MKLIETPLPGVVVIEPRVFADERGFFLETYHEEKYRDAGISAGFVQDNHSKSGRGTLRGLHYQLQHPQAKLCRVVSGEVLDVVVDIRRSSPTFGKWTSVLLSEENKRQIFVPRGFAHGFVVVTDWAEFLYKCDGFYRPDDEHGIAWDDPDVGIDWELEQRGIESLILSQKDRQNPTLASAAPEDLPEFSS